MLIIEPICYEEPTVIELKRPFVVLLVQHGEGKICLNKEWASLQTGRVFFLKDIDQLSFEGELLIGQLIEFQEMMLHIFLQQFVSHRDKGLYDPAVKLPFVDLRADRMKHMLDMIGLLMHEMDEGTSVVIFMHQLFLLLRHVNRDVELLAPLNPRKEKLLLELMKLINGHYKIRKTSFFAEEMEMTSKQLNRFSKQVFDKKFFDVLMDHLMNEADLLLTDRSVSIKNIAYDLGFESPGHFSTYYLRCKGMTPSEFRTKWGK